jgi:hypothetical protein
MWQQPRGGHKPWVSTESFLEYEAMMERQANEAVRAHLRRTKSRPVTGQDLLTALAWAWLALACIGVWIWLIFSQG